MSQRKKKTPMKNRSRLTDRNPVAAYLTRRSNSGEHARPACWFRRLAEISFPTDNQESTRCAVDRDRVIVSLGWLRFRLSNPIRYSRPIPCSLWSPLNRFNDPTALTIKPDSATFRVTCRRVCDCTSVTPQKMSSKIQPQNLERRKRFSPGELSTYFRPGNRSNQRIRHREENSYDH
jgi:hypothetical protein